MANDVKQLCEHFSSLSVKYPECKRCCQLLCPCERDPHFCRYCLDVLVASGATNHPITQNPLPICVCGRYFGTECRMNAIFGAKETTKPIIFTSDAAENKRLLLAAKMIEAPRHFIKK